MKKKNLVILALLLGTVFLLNSCASASTTQGNAKTLEEAHPDRFEKTVIGMDIKDFKKVWPEARRSGMSNNEETYEFIYTHLAFTSGYGGLSDYIIYTYFYFTNEKLTKYESTQETTQRRRRR